MGWLYLRHMSHELMRATCFRWIFFVVGEELLNLDFSDALCFWKKCGDQKEEKGSGARVDEEGSAESDGIDEVAVGEDRCKDGEAGHGDRQSGHQAAKLLQNIINYASLVN